MDRTGYLPRFHPLICEHRGVVAWWICDGHANREHSLAIPYLNEPCVDKYEAEELAILLNEEYEQE